MKKFFILSCLSLFMFANEDYVPLSSFSDNQKADYNFINNSIIDATDLKTDATDDGYESVKEVVEPMKTNKIVIEEDNKDIIKKEEIVKEYKKDNILQDTKKDREEKVTKKAENNDFSVSPKLTFTYLKSDVYGTDKISAVDEKTIFVPEIAFRYKNHILKADSMDVKAYYDKVLISGSDLETKTTWQKLNYLYVYENTNFGLAYNKYELDWKVVRSGNIYPDREEFPTLEFNMKNEDKNLLAEYGVSYGKNEHIDYVYEYYVNLGYKILKNDNLVLSGGYKNKTLDYDKDLNFGYKFQYKGPTISLGGTF